MDSERAVLIGFGSIGKIHFRTAAQFYSEIFVVDTDSEKFKELSDISKELNMKIEFYDDVNELPREHNYSLCIIANWGPDHFQTFEFMVSLGCKSFIIEKPFTSKLSDLYKMREISHSNGLKVISNLQSNFSYFNQLVMDLSAKYELGNPVGIQVSGGAKCVATNGIHYLALASQIFNEWPTHVVADLRSDPINPRRSDLLFLGGVASWRYNSGKHLSIHFQNDSHLNVTLKVVFQDAFLEVVNNTYKLFGINKQVIEGFTKAAHTSSATQLLSTGEAFEIQGSPAPIHNLYSEFRKIDSTQAIIEVGIRATEGIIGAVISSTVGRRIDLNVDGFGYPEYLETDWKIS
jgi:predicted dehydrogenase